MTHTTTPTIATEMTVETLCRAMIEQKASAVIVHIDGVEYKLSLKRQKP